MKKRAMSMLLVLLMVVTLFPTFALPAAAADDDGITNPEPAQDASKQLNLTKTLAPGANGTYDITMESWATGEVKHITEKVPTDFVVVVDQSGSMNKKDMVVGGSDSFTKQTGATLEDAAGGNYYVYDAANDMYYRVYGKHGYCFYRYDKDTYYVDDLYNKVELMTWFSSNTQVAEGAKGYYYLDGGIFYPITIKVSGEFLNYECYLSYNKNGTKTYLRCWHDRIWPARDSWEDYHSWRCIEVPNTSLYTRLDAPASNKIQHDIYKRHAGYVGLYYRDVNGVEHPVTTTGGLTDTQWCNETGTYSVTSVNGSQRMTYNDLYKLKDGDQYTQTRLQALNGALKEFAEEIAGESDNFGPVDNRISIIGFSSDGFNNTELLTNDRSDFAITSGTDTTGWGSTSSSMYSLDGQWHNGVQKAAADADLANAGTDTSGTYYANALVAANNGTAGQVNNKVYDAIDALTAHGGTKPADGLNMANQVLANRQGEVVDGHDKGKEYQYRSGDKAGQWTNRNTVVIFFTDGQPGNYDYSDQYDEANKVVEAALPLKNAGATVYTIGVFGESDGNPLTYNNNGEYYRSTNGVNEDWQYLGGWVKNVKVNNTWYCLQRQWRPNNAVGYTTVANDTIFDYMSVVSSNYPNAEDFIAPAWLNGTFDFDHGDYVDATNGVRNKDTATQNNEYYRMASDQKTLINAFLQAATTTSEESSSEVVLDTTAEFKDTVNLADFDASGATFTAYSVDANTDGTFGTTAKENFTPQYDAETGELTVKGFDYSGKYVTSGHAGQKLIVKISGLTPLRAGGELKSNKDVGEKLGAGIYAKGSEDPTVQIASPTLVIPGGDDKTFVIDYNAKMTVATDVQTMKNNTAVNGNFDKAGNDVTYQLDTEKQADKIAEINHPYVGVDSAMVYLNSATWNKITTVPASSVYYDDDFTGEEAPTITVGEGHGYNAEIDGEAVSEGAANVTGPFYFTFYGTGIDVYCTTHENGGYVSAAVFSGSGKDACTATNRVGDAKTIRNYSDSNYYNTPSVSFTGLTAGTYTLKINAPTNAQFKLDGVRVYNPVKAEDAEHNQTDASKTLETTDEANANYLNLRELLLNAQGGFSVVNQIPQDGTIDPAAVSGVLFINDVNSVVTESHWYKDDPSDPEAVDEWHEDAAPIYQSQFDVYKANGPKNEIYLNGGQAVTFQLNTSKVPAGTKVWIGLSAPADGSGSVSITGKDGSVTVGSVMDMYYDFTVPTNGSVTITNLGGEGDIIAITNLKITGIANLIPAVTQNNQEEVFHAARAVFAPVTMKTIRMAANNGVDPEEVVEEPENPNVPDTPDVPDNPDTPDQPDDPTPGAAGSVQEMLKQLFESLMKNLFGLFKGLGNW